MMPQVPNFTSFNQVEFVPGTARGYALTETGEVLETSDNGETWQRLPGGDVRQMHAWQNAVTWQRGGNELVIYPMKKQAAPRSAQGCYYKSQTVLRCWRMARRAFSQKAPAK